MARRDYQEDAENGSNYTTVQQCIIAVALQDSIRLTKSWQQSQIIRQAQLTHFTKQSFCLHATERCVRH